MKRPVSAYPQRRYLRGVERGWARLEGLVNRVTAAAEPLRPYNPLYHLGALLIFLLLLLAATGIVLLLLYRPGADRAYESVQAISRSWLAALVRSVHRYASDALIVVAFLHALKMLLSDRFWGSRWLAWLSGWLLVVLFWFAGTTGYFLVWDAAAQWLTEYAVNTFGGAFALSFFGPQAVGRTYSFFLIVLFVHAFLPLILAVGVLVHVLRLQRPRYWPPRWLMAVATAALILLSLLWPVAANLPADFRRLVVAAQLDWWYMGFLPLSGRLGDPAFWGVGLAVLAAVVALPWLLAGRHNGPSTVDAERCTGCAACARECPYNAIEMVRREDGSAPAPLALVKGHLCTGCGICVAACGEDAIELRHLALGGLHRQAAAALAQAQSEGRRPLLVYACDRHMALGSLPDLDPRPPLPLREAQAILAGEGAKERIRLGVWPGTARPAVLCALPCIGALHPDAVANALAAGAGDVLLVACPAHDCGYREGPRWLDERRARRPILRRPDVHLVAAAPGNREAVLAAAARAAGNSPPGNAGDRAAASSSVSSRAHLRSVIVGLALLTTIFAAAGAANRSASRTLPQAGQIRIAINHHGQLLAKSRDLPADVVARLPAGVDPALVLGGERFPVRLQLLVDGRLALERTYRPGGLRREGSIYGLESWWVPPGAYRIEIRLMDDAVTWRTAFDGTVEVGPQAAATLIFDPGSNGFVLWR